MTTYESDVKLTKAIFMMGGIVSLVFGLLLLTRTQQTIEIIMLLLGLWWLIQGIFNLFSIFIDKAQWGWKLLGGAFGILAGLLVLNFPMVGGMVYLSITVIILGVFGLIFGIAALIAAFQGGGWGAGISVASAFSSVCCSSSTRW